MTKTIPLPIRIAHPPKPQLEHLDDAYFEFLVKCGCQGLYLQDSPFDKITGNHGAFKKQFHLIYLYDIAYGPERQAYVDYINEVCRRAARHGLETHLCCWEPRLPFNAWGETPAAWRGRGGFYYAGHMNVTSFCWSEPEAVAYWRQMARDAFAALPGIAGVHLGVVDNEANFCDETCPKCVARTQAQQLEDIYATFAEIKAARPKFRIAIYDWWLPPALLERLPGIVGHDALIIGRSSQGHSQPPLPGEVEDMTTIFGGCGPGILEKKKKADRLGLRLVDMPAWSHPNEAWWLPPPPDPLYAVEKLNALRALGAVGWYDFDCGAIEPGAIAEAIMAWTADPDAAPERLVERVLEGIFRENAKAATPAYEQYRRAKPLYPIADHDPVVPGFSGRCLGLGKVLFGPFRPEDFRFLDTKHCFNWFAPFNLVLPSTLPVILPRVESVQEGMREAFLTIDAVTASGAAARRERETFEIHYRHYRAIWNYLRLGQARLDRLEGRLDDHAYAARIRELAADEQENLAATEAWCKRNPGALFNPCHDLLGHLEEAWPNLDFRNDLFGPKRASLVSLVSGTNHFSPVGGGIK